MTQEWEALSKLDAVPSKSPTVWELGVGTRNSGTEVAVASTAQEVMGPTRLQGRPTQQ